MLLGEQTLKRVPPYSLISQKWSWWHRWCSARPEGQCGFVGGRNVMDRHFSQDALQVYTILSTALWKISNAWASTGSLHTWWPGMLLHPCKSDFRGRVGDQPPPPHAWSSLLIADMLQKGIKEEITEAVVLALREAILFFGWQSHKEGHPLEGARDVGFCLMDPTSWAGRTAQVEATVGTVQEGHHAIAEAVIENRTKARGPGCPCGMTKVTKTPATAYNTKEWKRMPLKRGP